MAARKLNFFLMTLGVSFVVVSLMAAAAGTRSEETASSRTPLWTELPPEAPPQGKDNVPGPSERITVMVPSFADIVERVNPAVVNITATEILRSGQRTGGNGRFEFFFPNPRNRGRDLRR